VTALAALSTGETIPNPRHLRAARRRLLNAQRALSRTQKGSARRRRCARILGRRHHEVAENRATTLHTLTKRLATGWASVAIEDLNVTGMTASARGTREQPGRNVKAKAGLNKSILDGAFGELRRQITYKTSWYGSALAVCDRWFPSIQQDMLSMRESETQTLPGERVFRCDACGLVLNRGRERCTQHCRARGRRLRHGGDVKRPPRRSRPRTPSQQTDLTCIDAEAGRPPCESSMATPGEQSPGLSASGTQAGQLACAPRAQRRADETQLTARVFSSRPRSWRTKASPGE
jgi:putative transposase